MIATFTSQLELNEELNSFGNEQAELIEKLLSIGTALSSSHDLSELLTLILSKSCEITCSDAGSVYLIDNRETQPQLYFKVAQNYSLPQLKAQEFVMPLTLSSLAGYVALTGKRLNIPDAYALSAELPYRLDPTLDRDYNYRTCSVLVLPMQDQQGEIIGVLQLINRKIDPNLTITPENALEITQPYTPWEERILQSLASQAAISIERNQLQDSIENLFEGFVKASVQLIEMRDPTMSGHSERVADLTVRLAQEVNAVEAGLLRSIQLNHRQLQEIRYASLLHDFGKVCVPEAILNKRKKLYPEQLQLLRQRFTIAHRTLETECAQRKYEHLLKTINHHHPDQGSCPHCQTLGEIDQEYQLVQKKLDTFMTLVEQLNEPEALVNKQFEAFSEEAFAQLTELSEYTYRDLDGQIQPLIKLEEIEQLLVPRGNLTPEERQKTEAHVTHTYEFLKEIPWTKALENVPQIAYGHHEKLDGSGYPQGLEKEMILIQSQMMTIADIYDALTASDRPYKKALPVDVALNLLKKEASRNKVNSELVTLFEQREVFRVVGHSLGT
jgi:HD-GYP domain-containing protein (c-di-GMP phosphodiesterase class II)